MSFFKETRYNDIGMSDALNNSAKPKITVSVKKGIWFKNNGWNCYKRNQFEITVDIISNVRTLFLQNSSVLKYKIEISCSDTLNKSQIQQKTKNGFQQVQSVYIPAEPFASISIPKLHFSRCTPINKNRNLSDQYFQVLVNVSIVDSNNVVSRLATFTSESLNVLSGGPSKHNKTRLIGNDYYRESDSCLNRNDFYDSADSCSNTSG
ncbi:hypothetical protein HDV01_002525, partial [Terramyces sp. JEL0728]